MAGQVSVLAAARRYRLIGAALVIGALATVGLIGGDPQSGRTGGRPEHARPQATELTAGEAAAPNPTPGLPVGAFRVPLGDWDAPASGVAVQPGVPAGVPLAPEAGRSGPGVRTLTVRRETAPAFRAVGVTWGGTAARVSVAARVHLPRGGWGSWRAAGPTAGPSAGPTAGGGPGSGRGGAELLWTGPGDGVELAVTLLAGPPPAQVAADLIDPHDTAADTLAEPPAPAPDPDGRVTMPTIHRRAEWGADERQMTWPPAYARQVRAVAWAGLPTGNDYAASDVPKILRARAYFEAVGLGHGDLGANAFVDRFGRLWEGRAGGLSRAVVGGGGEGTAGLCILGDHRAGEPVPPAAVEAAARYVAWKLSLASAADPRTRVSAEPGLADALPQLRQRAYDLIGAWANPNTMRLRLATWRPATAAWTVRGQDGAALVGSPGDLPVPADYDGDGIIDLAVWTPSTGTWTIHNSAGGTTEQVVLGGRDDRPVPADYNGDGRAEPATWTPRTGTWHIAGVPPLTLGRAGDVPVPADYTGDGRADPAVWRPSTGAWLIRGMRRVHLGRSWQLPVPADYDGDGVAEPATYSPLSHRWFRRGHQPVRFGAAGDVPVPGQYDGDGRAEFAVWHPPGGAGSAGGPAAPAGGAGAAGGAGGTGTWRVFHGGTYPFGGTGELPVPVG